jgi:hypothetical protein
LWIYIIAIIAEPPATAKIGSSYPGIDVVPVSKYAVTSVRPLYAIVPRSNTQLLFHFTVATTSPNPVMLKGTSPLELTK